MKVKFDAIVPALDGSPIKSADGKELTVRSVCINSLHFVTRDEAHTLTGEEKVRRWEISRKIHQNPEAELTIEEVALIKSLVGRPGTPWEPFVVGPVWEILESKNG